MVAFISIRELKQPRWRRQQKPHKFAYSTMKNSIFARFACAFFIFWHFEDVLVLSRKWNNLFCSCVDDASMWCQMLNFVSSCPKRCRFQFNSRIVWTHFSSIMTETRSYIFRWCSRFCWSRVCLSSLMFLQQRTIFWWENVFCLSFPSCLVPHLQRVRALICHRQAWDLLKFWSMIYHQKVKRAVYLSVSHWMNVNRCRGPCPRNAREENFCDCCNWAWVGQRTEMKCKETHV